MKTNITKILSIPLLCLSIFLSQTTEASYSPAMPYLYESNGGQIGIGTANPQAKLEIKTHEVAPTGSFTWLEGETIITGTGTNFTSAFQVGECLLKNESACITSIPDDETIHLNAPTYGGYINQPTEEINKTALKIENGAILHENEYGFTTHRIRTYSHDYNYNSALIFEHANGTKESPTQTLNKTAIGEIQARGYDGESFKYSTSPFIFRADGDWNEHSKGLYTELKTTPLGKTRGVLTMTLRNGKVGIGSQNPADPHPKGKLDVDSDLVVTQQDLSILDDQVNPGTIDTPAYAPLTTFQNLFLDDSTNPTCIWQDSDGNGDPADGTITYLYDSDGGDDCASIDHFNIPNYAYYDQNENGSFDQGEEEVFQDLDYDGNYDAYDGYVGIGTAAPNYKLQIGEGCDAAKGNCYTDNISVGGGHIITNNPNGALVFDAGPDGTNTNQSGFWFRIDKYRNGIKNYTNLLRIKESGNLGIGTVTPKGKLDVDSDLVVTRKDPIILNDDGVIDAPAYATLTNLGVVYIDNVATPTCIWQEDDADKDPATGVVTYIYDSDGGDDCASIDHSIHNDIAYYNKGGIAGYDPNSDELFQDLDYDGNYDAYDGNVGIGTTDPQGLLEVRTNAPGYTDITSAIFSRGTYQKLHIIEGGSGHFFKGFSAVNNAKEILFDVTTDEANTPLTQGSIGYAFRIYGVEKMRIDENGNVGIGTGSPQSKLDVQGEMFLKTSTGVPVIKINEGEGNVAVGPDISFNAQGLIAAESSMHFTIDSDNNDTNSIYTFNADSDVTPFPKELMRIRSDGNVGIGVTVPQSKLHISGDVLANNYNTTSDERLKENIHTIDSALEKILNLRGTEFTWKENGKESVGFIAQEVETVLPELVKTGSDDIKSVQYGNITAVLVEAVKELKQENDELKALVCLDHGEAEICQ